MDAARDGVADAVRGAGERLAFRIREDGACAGGSGAALPLGYLVTAIQPMNSRSPMIRSQKGQSERKITPTRSRQTGGDS